MSLVLCEVSEGLRASEATVKLTTVEGAEHLPVDRSFLVKIDEKDYLFVGLIHTNPDRKVALITLPVEADSGANRVWVTLDQIKEESVK